MKTQARSSPPNIGLTALLAAGLMFVVVQNAAAAGTASGTSISNYVTLDYTVGTQSQPSIDSAAVSFLVDNKVNLTVAKVLDNAGIIPGTNKVAVAFSVTNNGNTAQRYALTAVAGASTLSNALTGASIYLDNGSAPGIWDATDTLYGTAGTFGDVAPDATINVLIVADVPAVELNGQTEVYSLLAQTIDAGVLTVTAQTVGVDTAAVDVVFADPMSGIAGDSGAVRDGQHAVSATYTVATASMTITKTAVVYSDPVNGVSANAKAIPGAVVIYTITVTNGAGASTATSVAISDSLNAEIAALNLDFQTQYIDGTNTCAVGEGIVVGGVCKTNASAVDDNTDWNVTVANTVTATGLSVAAGASVVIKFQAVIQ